MQTYQTKRKSAPARTARPQAQPVTADEMLHLSNAGAPQPMSPALREKFEPGFSADFSNIRISRGHIPQEMGVQAVARGTDILLDSSAGMDVLGHELAHAVQQAQGRVEGGYPVVENAALEHEADVMGARVASGLTAQAGPQNGFGGELTTIAPMSGASAPAQCKSKEEKEAEKAAKAGGYSKADEAELERANGFHNIHQKLLDDNAWKSRNYYAAMEQYNAGQTDPAKKYKHDAADVNRQRFLQRHMTGTEEENLALFRDVMERGDEAMLPKLKEDAQKIMNFDTSTFFPNGEKLANADQMLANPQMATDMMILSKDTHNFLDLLRTGRITAQSLGVSEDQFQAFQEKQNDFARKSSTMMAPVNKAKRMIEDANPALKAAVGDRGAFKNLQNGRDRFISDHITPAPLPPQVTRPRPAPGPSLAPKPGQQYTTQADLPQSGADWSHTGSWKHTKSNYDFADDRMDIMPGGSDASGFSLFTGETETPAPKKKRNIFSRLFGR